VENKMNLAKKYRLISSRFLSSRIEPHLEKFSSLHSDLRRANIDIMLRDYISMCFFTSLLAFVISFPISFAIAFTLGKTTLFSLVLSSSIGAGLFALSLFAGFKYPYTKADERRRNIDSNLPFAALYMNTIAGTGAPPYLMFKLLSEFKEYGEVTAEAQGIVQDVEVMGRDLEDALRRAAEQTPSEELKDLLWGMITTIVRGGDLRSLLKDKSVLLMDEYRRKMQEYADNLTMYVEVYITLVIVGSIFGIVMSTIMGTISGFGELRALQEILVFVFLPFASMLFLIILKLTTPI